MTRPATEVASGVLVMTSRREATTSTVIAARGEGLVVDPAWDPDELEGVAGVLQAAGVRCAAGVATHEHYDHVLWHPSLPRVAHWATPWTVTRWLHHREELLGPLVGDLPESLLAEAGRVDAVPEAPRPAERVPRQPYPRDAALPDPYPLPWRGREIILHEHDAHVRGHLALEIVDADVLIAGDMLSDIELPYPDEHDADLVPYLVGLDRLSDVVRRCRVLIPGHGSPTLDPLARLDADRRYLDAVLAGREPNDPRLANPGMAQIHARNVEQARETLH